VALDETVAETLAFTNQRILVLGAGEAMAPLGTVFEISLMTFLDAVVVELMHRLSLGESELARHAAINNSRSEAHTSRA
jgi:D-arabinose 5-phosphate isomerase GutQ